jgi:nitrous oxidase accessory protein
MKYKNKKKMLGILISIIFLLLNSTCLTVSSEKIISIKITSDTIIVNAGDSIQNAIENADTGDTIFVKNGVYNENIFINKTITLKGEDKYNTIIDGRGTGNVVKIIAYGVKLSDFTIKNCGEGNGKYNANICVLSSDNTISNNIITDEKLNVNWGFAGIYIHYFLEPDKTGNMIEGNDISKTYIGIFIHRSRSNTFTNNKIHDTFGINIIDWKYGEGHNIFEFNKVYNSPNSGFHIQTNNNIIRNNEIYDNGKKSNQNDIDGVDGIIIHADKNLIEGNNISNNFGEGISFQDRWGKYPVIKNNVIRNNNIFGNNKCGIKLDGTENQVIKNNIYANKYNIYLLDESKNNTIHHNNFYDAVEKNIKGETVFLPYCDYNIWDDGTDGNYWDDYEERYPENLLYSASGYLSS